MKIKMTIIAAFVMLLGWFAAPQASAAIVNPGHAVSVVATVTTPAMIASSANLEFDEIVDEEVIEDDYIDEPVAAPAPTKAKHKGNTGNILISILVLLVIIGVFAHMVYIKFFVEKKVLPIRVEEMVEMRAAAGKAPHMSEAELAKCDEIDEYIMNNCFTPFVNNVGEEDGIPTSRVQVEALRAKLAELLALQPTEQEVVEYYNSVAEIYNQAVQREFCGSKVLLWIAGIIGAICCFAGVWGFLPVILFSMATYYLSALKPVYVLYRMELNGESMSGGCVNAILGGAFGAVAAAKTYTTVTKWSDGTTTREDDNSETWVSLILAIVVSVVLVCIMAIIAVVNYLRNYILVK